MTWLEALFGAPKPIIGMCHLLALPGDPGYRRRDGFSTIIDRCERDLHALQDGGVDAVLFSNEGSLPYLTRVDAITIASMARVIGQIRRQITVPFGVDVLWDARATVELAVATEAQFVREVFSGAYASDFGLWHTEVGRAVRHLHALGGSEIRMLFNIVPESAAYLAPRNIADIARSTVFNCRPDALCVSGLIAGAETSLSTLKEVKLAVNDTPVLANTGVRLENVREQLAIADGAVVGTTLKTGGDTWNPVDRARVNDFMARVKEIREQKDRGS